MCRCSRLISTRASASPITNDSRIMAALGTSIRGIRRCPCPAHA